MEGNAARKPYRGSCHCGKIKYVVWLVLPPANLDLDTSCGTSIRMYKCNCSTCLKLGMFHLRLEDSPNDFVVLSPLSFEEPGVLGDYRTFAGEYHWYFCNDCGVRCFGFAGTGGKGGPGGELVQRERQVLGLAGDGLTTVWKPSAKGWVEGEMGYLSVNATTLDQDQPDLDLREWTEKGWIYYMDCKQRTGANRYKLPHPGGIY
jgi:hypothetical protein